MIYFLNY